MFPTENYSREMTKDEAATLKQARWRIFAAGITQKLCQDSGFELAAVELDIAMEELRKFYERNPVGKMAPYFMTSEDLKVLKQSVDVAMVAGAVTKPGDVLAR